CRARGRAAAWPPRSAAPGVQHRIRGAPRVRHLSGETSRRFRVCALSRGQKEEAVAEAVIRQHVEALVKAILAKDIDGITSLYAPNLVSFDIAPPLRYVGADNKRRAWQKAIAAFAGPISYEVRDLSITTDGELALVHSLNHVSGTLASGRRTNL